LASTVGMRPNPNGDCSKCLPPRGCSPTSRPPSSPTAAKTSRAAPLPQPAGRAPAGLVPPHDAHHRADPVGQGPACPTRAVGHPRRRAATAEMVSVARQRLSLVANRRRHRHRPRRRGTPAASKTRAGTTNSPRRYASSAGTSPRTPRPYPNFGERYRAGEIISTSFVESAVNHVISKRMVKKQQMRWSPRGAHLLLQIPFTATNDTLGRW